MREAVRVPHNELLSLPRVKGPAWARLPLINLGTLGVRILWSVQSGYATPYLVSLGLSKSWISMVYVAGPIAGLVTQPLVGAYSDRSTSKYGRRRPYIAVGVVISVLAVLLLGYTKAIASIFASSQENRDRLTVWLAVLSIYVVDFSVNAIMACSRALLIDALPAAEQDLGNAWAGRMNALGSICGFLVGNIDLPAILPALGHTQLQVISALCALILLFTNGAMVYAVKERPHSGHDHQPGSTRIETGILSTMKNIWSSFRSLPYTIVQICLIQLWSGLGGWPLGFYCTLWISNIYARSVPELTATPEQIADAGTRAGNRALLYSSLVMTASFVILPLVVSPSEPSSGREGGVRKGKGWKIHMHLATLWAISHCIFAGGLFATWFVDSLWAANTLFSFTGISWAISFWVPFAILGEEIHRHQSSESKDGYLPVNRGVDDYLPLRDRTSSGAISLHDEALEENASQSTLVDDPWSDIDEPASTGAQDQTGAILGIHNVFLVIPGFIATLVSALIFAITDSKPAAAGTVGLAGEPERFDSIGLCFRLGGLCVAVAAYKTWRLSQHLQQR